MRLVNTTSIPNSTIREVIRFVLPPGCHNFDVRVSGCHTGYALAGRAYPDGCPYHDRPHTPLVVLRVAPSGYPYDEVPKQGRGYLGMPRMESPLDALVFVAAHELRHLWQSRSIKRGRAKGSRGKGYSETDADSYAFDMLDKWRLMCQEQEERALASHLHDEETRGTYPVRG